MHAGVEQRPDSGWLWVLHDDSAPEPDALGVLLRHAADQPSVAVWGPKVLGWDEPRRLLEVGVTHLALRTSVHRARARRAGPGPVRRSARRARRRQRRARWCGATVWSDLGGFDRALRFFREDVDLGWRANLAGHRVVVATDAVVHHAEAMARGRRAGAAGDPHAIDRASALLHAAGERRGRRRWLLRWLWLLLQTLVRALGFVLGKAPREAAAETGAIGDGAAAPRRGSARRDGRGGAGARCRRAVVARPLPAPGAAGAAHARDRWPAR